jgi:hypothetical protein
MLYVASLLGYVKNYSKQLCFCDKPKRHERQNLAFAVAAFANEMP